MLNILKVHKEEPKGTSSDQPGVFLLLKGPKQGFMGENGRRTPIVNYRECFLFTSLKVGPNSV